MTECYIINYLVSLKNRNELSENNNRCYLLVLENFIWLQNRITLELLLKGSLEYTTM